MANAIMTYLKSRAMASSPAYAQEQMYLLKRQKQQEDAQKMASLADYVYGNPGAPAETTTQEQPMVGPMRPGRSRPMIVQEMQKAAQPASGIYQQQMSPEERYLQLQQRMLSTGQPGFINQQSNLLSNMQNSVMSNYGRDGNSDFGFEEYMSADPQTQELYDRFKGRFDFAGGSDDPAKVKTAKYFASLSPEGKEQFLRATRNQNYVDFGTYKLNPNTGEQRDIDIMGRESQQALGGNLGESIANYPKARRSANNIIDSIDETLSVLTEMSGMTDWDTSAFGSWLSVIPASDAKTWKELKTTVQAKIALESMASLKELSPTGSTGFGALSEKELDVLQKQFGSLEQSQSPEAIKKSIQRIANTLQSVKIGAIKAREIDDNWYKKQWREDYGVPSYDELNAQVEVETPELLQDKPSQSQQMIQSAPMTQNIGGTTWYKTGEIGPDGTPVYSDSPADAMR